MGVQVAWLALVGISEIWILADVAFVVGQGNYVRPLEDPLQWDHRGPALDLGATKLVRHVEGLASCGRVLMLDRRGTGLSDRVRGTLVVRAHLPPC